MSAFRIERSRDGIAPRVYHESDSRLAVAVILKEDDGTVCLFRSRWDNVPSPIAEQSMVFANESAVRVFLGLEEDINA